MGLRDHFRPPLHPARGWAPFLSNWATRIADALDERWLPREYIATEHTHLAADPAPARPDAFEVRVLTEVGGATLVGVIELVSPANKDRPEQRRAFATKCAGFLHQGVSVIVVDVVTTRTANLHDDIVEALGTPALRFTSTTGLYAVAYRPVLRAGEAAVDVWAAECALGGALPTLPLRLQGDVFVPVDFASTYEEACRKRRIPAA